MARTLAYPTLLALLAVTFVPACSTRGALPVLQTAPQQAMPGDRVPEFSTSGAVYVGTPGQVAVYASAGKARIASIPQGNFTAAALAFSPSGTLYVGDQTAGSGSATCGAGGSLNFYKAGAKAAKRVIKNGITCPVAVAFRGSIYVLNASNKLTVYDPKTGKLLRTVTQGIQTPTAMAFDPFGNLYVTNVTAHGSSSSGSGTLTMFAPNATAPTKTIAFSSSIPTALAVDSSGDVYVGSVSNQPFTCASSASSGGPVGAVTEFAPKGSGSVLRTISGLKPVTALAIDPKNNLYVAAAIQTNACVSSSSATYSGGLGVFGPTATKPSRSLTLIEPYLLALDDANNVYAADCSNSDCTSFVVREIAAGGVRITRNLAVPGQPAALAAQP
ncbi:MAG: hypothetical protein JO160_02675 [Candidatus Eremiobacteraeota bacterium]|nr:hypothetical protein [Candidatus Eremiobacteraeota bacterium]